MGLLGLYFHIKKPNFERHIMEFINLIIRLIYNYVVANVKIKYNMEKLNEMKRTFDYFSYARYATDVTFQQSFRPCGLCKKVRFTLAENKNCTGYKAEMSAQPIWLDINETRHYPGSVSDLEIFERNISFQESATLKLDVGEDQLEIGVPSEEFPDLWALLLDKGYYGDREILTGLHPIKTQREDF